MKAYNQNHKSKSKFSILAVVVKVARRKKRLFI